MRLIAEGTDDEDTDAELRLDAVSAYVELLDKPNLPDILVKIICWVRARESVSGDALSYHIRRPLPILLLSFVMVKL